ncbi:Agenet domain protein [Quillaja saponaria]|uniref:Agenet domain protein n=1 Tax=Quillaja saponaria TaxID=32244 RepID=A0AAD7L6K3_QUISA|nr:Agenet domain protein [Quillaja saponaria]KAJ7952518.1 Agenet domain protein [Quillaja saponaria]
MDYDDNDFQSQNVHLVGEGSTKFPPVLRPYAIPKFDFDESLQGHLRFDSLVETEVFLGIESHEDNQWIDDFSRGSSGIEFSSSAAGSCLSRHQNVWSEATSSESVEMLLKSVGQEEFIPRPTIEGSDACDELICLVKQMEPNLSHDNKTVSSTESVVEFQPADKISEKNSDLNEDVERERVQIEVSQTCESEISIDGSSSKQDADAACRKINLAMLEKSLSTDGQCEDTNQREAETNKPPLDEKAIEDSSASTRQLNNLVLFMQNISSSYGMSNNQNPQDSLPAETDKPEKDSQAVSKDADLDGQVLNESAVRRDEHPQDNPLPVALNVKSMEAGNTVESGVSNVEQCTILSEGDSDSHKGEKSGDDICPSYPVEDSRSEDTIILTDRMIVDQSGPNTCELSKEVLKGDTGFEKCLVVDYTNNRLCPSVEPKMYPILQKAHGESSVIKEDILLNSGYQSDREISVTKSEAQILSAEDNNISKGGDANRDSSMGGISSLSVDCSSPKSCILGESTQVCENDKVERQDDIQRSLNDASVNDKDSTKSPDYSKTDCNVVQSLVDKDVDFPTLGNMKTELTVSKVLVDVTAVTASASDVTLENTNLTFLKTIDAPLAFGSGLTIQEEDQNDVQMTTSIVGSTALFEKEQTAIRISNEASEERIAPALVCVTEQDQSRDTAEELMCDTAGHSLQIRETCSIQNYAEVKTTVADDVTQECTEGIDGSPILCESTVKQADVAEPVVSFEKHEEVTAEENYENASSKVSGVTSKACERFLCSTPLPDSHAELHKAGSCLTTLDKVTCNPSFTIISASCQTDKTRNEGKGSANQNAEGCGFIDGQATNLCSISQDAKGNGVSKDDGSFTFDVNPSADLCKKDNVENRQSLPAATAGKTLPIVEGPPSTSYLCQTKHKVVEDTPCGTPQVSDGEIAQCVPKGTPERKRRRASVKASGKESSRKGSRAKETTPTRQPKIGEKSSIFPPSPTTIFQLMQSTEPFTDLQQVQLRAQIFVYGALIQGTAPDEAYMISAFGGPDGGRSIWEKAWRAFMERLHVQKSHSINMETPLQSHSGPRASDFVVKQSVVQGKDVSSPVGRTSSKTATPTIVNPLIPLSSPLWSIPTPSCDSIPRGSAMDYQQALTPLHPYQSSSARNFLGHSTSWISQATFHGPWIASPQNTAPDNNAHLSASPVVDTVKLTSVIGSPLPPSSGIKSANHGLPVSSGGSHSVLDGTVPALDSKNVTVSLGQHSDPKPRKRKKIPVSENIGQNVLQSRSRVESVSVPAATSHLFTSVALMPPAGSMSSPNVEKSIMHVSPLSSIDHLKTVQWDVEKRGLSEESLNKVKEARVNAEEAAALSSAAVRHSQEIWDQLDKHKNSGLVSEIEVKLASAAVAVAAAASVAKAAAAAANVASNAALQAKLMADEALASSGYDHSSQNIGIFLSDGVNNIGKATPASILKGANGANSSSSIIVAAKEAVRRRVEAASATTKRAENMDAVVKAAELAAEAVSQAGKIVAMGEPLPLKDLVESGPEGCWKVSQVSSELVAVSIDLTRGIIDIVGDGPDTARKVNKESMSDEKEMETAKNKKSPLHKESYNETSEDYIRLVDGSSGSGMVSEKDSGVPKGPKVSDFVVARESEIGPPSSIDIENGSEKLADNNIKEGSLVEVFKDGERIKAAWFTANVLNLKDDTAFVCYTELQSDDGSGQLKEWVSLQGEGDKPPKIRIARPVIDLCYEGTRKRRRAAMGDYAWSVGDRVDAWIQESWLEGVVTDKNKKDESAVTVHFPAHGETLVVRAWHLRPSVTWKNGNWIEWSRLQENKVSSHEGDTPHEKRPRLGSPAVELKGKEKAKNVDAMEPVNPEELRLLDLADNEKVFNIGKNTKNENKPHAQSIIRTGLQKEGSRVVFGVPKPGKKRKFMEVSKHYIANKSSKINAANESVKIANYLMPHRSGLRGWKSTSKHEAREKEVAESNPKTLKSGKPQSVSGRTISRKDNLLISATNDMTDHTGKTMGSVSHVKDASISHNQMEIGSYPGNGGTVEGPTLYSSLAASSDAPSSKKISGTKSERLNKGKLAPDSGKLAKIVEEKASNGNAVKSASEVTEPRRSNRRIQPTSRLLEGLQSSLIISKIPSVSHDKGHKSQNRNASKGDNHG